MAHHRVRSPTSAKAAAPEVVDDIADGGRRVTPGVRLLDRSSDPSHNRRCSRWPATPDGAARGDPDALRRERSTRSICAQHHGEHPRLGAVDVVPFVPDRGRDDGRLRGAGARRSPPRSARGSACRSTSTRRPQRHRRGATSKTSAAASSKGWRRRWQRRSGRPTSGRPSPHPTAGATVIGARMPLIAYNINLATDRAGRRQEDRRRRPPQQRRPALREGDGRDARGPAHRAGVDEPDQLREDANARACSSSSSARPRATA